MQTKTPVALDTSYWESIPDFALVKPRPLYVTTRATLGTSYKDPTFIRYFTDLGYDSIRRGAYHAFKKAYSSITQAQLFANFVKPYMTPKDVVELDFEEGGETAAQLLDWIHAVQDILPDNLVMLYSRRILMDAIPMTAAQKAEMKTFPVWVAGYPENPDLYSSVPQMYIPDPTRWGPVWMWQYSDNGIIEGIGGEVDLNWLAPEFVQWLSGIEPATGVPMYGKVIATSMNIRNGAGTAFVDIGDLYSGDLVEASEVVNGWWHLTSATRNGAPVITTNGQPVSARADCWASSGGGAYIQVTEPPVVIPQVDYITAHYTDGTTRKFIPA